MYDDARHRKAAFGGSDVVDARLLPQRRRNADGVSVADSATHEWRVKRDVDRKEEPGLGSGSFLVRTILADDPGIGEKREPQRTPGARRRRLALGSLAAVR